MAKSSKALWRLYLDGVASGDIPELASLGLPGLRRRRSFAPSDDAEADSDVNKILENLLYLWSEAHATASKDGDSMEGDKGKEEKIFELGMEFLDTVNTGNFDRCMELLNSGVPVNFQHPRTRETALHIAAGNTGWAWIKALNEHKDINFLIRDRQGKLPWDNANFFALDPKLADYLAEKTRAQAARDGVDLLAEHRGWVRKWFNEPWFNDLTRQCDFTPD